MANVNVKPDDLKRLQRSVAKAQQDVDQSLKELQRAFSHANWNDKAGRDFEAKLKEAGSDVRRTNQRLGELAPILTRKIAELQQYLGR